MVRLLSPQTCPSELSREQRRPSNCQDPPPQPATAASCMLKLADLPSDILAILAEMLGNPLALLVSKAHLSKAFCEAARAAQATLTHIDLGKVVVSFSVKQCGR